MDTSQQSPRPTRVLNRRSYVKRLKGLKKKAYELKTLADVEVSMVFYDPITNMPSMYPEDPSVVASTMKHFLGLPQSARNRKRCTVESMNKYGKEDPHPPTIQESEASDNQDDMLKEEDEDEGEGNGKLNLKGCSEKSLFKALHGLDENLKMLREKKHEYEMKKDGVPFWN